jgi:indole-3-glycerol phosphate synthase
MSHLSEILARKRDEVAARSREKSGGAMCREALATPPPRDFAGALSLPGEPLRVIAEVKRASPSAGAIRSDLDPATLARRYVEGGAAALSVLTDGPGFGGSLDDLRAVRAAVSAPILRKDFVVDPYQLLEARAAGADAVLLIVAALERTALTEFVSASRALGLSALVEVHTVSELEEAVEVGATLIGINNRNLATFEVDLATSEALLRRVPAGIRAVAESGVREVKDVRRLVTAGATNLLIGEALVRALDATVLLTEFLSTRPSQ